MGVLEFCEGEVIEVEEQKRRDWARTKAYRDMRGQMVQDLNGTTVKPPPVCAVGF